MKNRRLAAVLACRNNGSRLYGKPLQRIDIEAGILVLDQVIRNLKSLAFIDEIVLAISEGCDNQSFINYAQNCNLRFVVGDEIDVLGRLLKGMQLSDFTDLFRVTTESPFLYVPTVESAWKQHIESSYDATFMDNIIDGCGFEIITLDALKSSWIHGDKRHKSELCTLFIRENKENFKINQLCPPNELCRYDLRLTIDYPEDLVVCRSVYMHLKSIDSLSPPCIFKIVKYLDANPKLKNLVFPFTQDGYKSMYL